MIRTLISFMLVRPIARLHPELFDPQAALENVEAAILELQLEAAGPLSGRPGL